ncbi:MAG: polysaccharide deacetylase family protein [Lachnospiraceae bacterium]|nr:polysaccharide deacetylase family protein [Lachnospiraceae bacterium]
MKRHQNAFRTKLLTIVWLFTAALALILSVVYFEKLQKLYTQVEATQAQAQAAAAKDREKSGKAAKDSKTAAGSDEPKPETTEQAKQTASLEKKEQTGSADTAAPADRKDFEGYDNDPDTAEKSDTADTGSDDAAPLNADFDYTTGLDPDKPIIALSFDDGPSVYTERIVAALQKNHVSATFFMVGYNVENHQSLVRLVYDAGFEIGNHTSDHKRLTDLSRKDMTAEVFDNEDLINSIVPVGEIVVRPPYGSFNDTVASVVDRPMFNWSVDSEDWKTRDADQIVAQIKQDARDGYIILMHDLYESTAQAAERIIPWLLDQGYQITDISTMFKARGETPQKNKLYRYAPQAGN